MVAIRDQAGAGGEVSPAASAAPEPGQMVRVWDPLVRIFHWSLAMAFAVAWLTGDETEQVHIWAGYTIIGLLAVRIVWGVVGTAHARFSDFVYRPSTVFAYLMDAMRLRAKRYVGHNPAGGAMVLALILMIGATAATGFMMTTDAYWGVGWVEETHEIAANLSLLLVALHLAGVAFASFEYRENLVKAMITGRKRK